MIASLVAFAAVGFALIAAGGRLGRRAFVIAAVPSVAAAVWVLTRLGAVTDEVPVVQHVGWVSGLDLSIDLRLDGLAATMSLVVTGVGVLVLLYAARYFAPEARDLGRLAGLLVLFSGSMLGLVQADHLIFLYACWELTSVTSFLLIGNRHTESRARAAALHALLVTSAGGLAMLAGFVVLARESGSYLISEILEHPPPVSGALSAAMVLILLGAVTKSAQYPFHAWLPGAMAAPTPVSAYLHSATMVTAGVFLVARLSPLFVSTGLWRPLVLTTGCATLVFGGLRALRQHDLKLLLAFGTVSQLGLMMVLFGAGTPATTTAGWDLLVAHAAYKAALFMVVGIMDHQTGTRDIRTLPALRDGWRGVEVVTILALASMAGIPLAAGFVAKELAYESLGEATFAGHLAVLAVVVAGSMLTVAYAARFYWGAFVRPRRRSAEVGSTGATPAPPSFTFVAPAAVLAGVGLVLGIVPGLADPLATASLAGFGTGTAPVHLSLWHGVNAPLVLSALTLAGGAAIGLANRRLQPLLARGGAVPSGAEIYLGTLRRLGVVSARVTGFVQNGSLPVYVGVILLTAATLPAGALVVGATWNGWPPFGTLREAPIAIALMVHRAGGHDRAPPLLGRSVPRRRGLRDGGPVRPVGGARPRAHAGGGRDVVDRRVRARAPPPA